MRPKEDRLHPRCVALRKALISRGKQAFHLARKLGMQPQSVGQYMTGHRVPTLDWLSAAAEHIPCKPSELDPRLADVIIPSEQVKESKIER